MTGTEADWRQFALLLIDMQQDFLRDKITESFPQFPDNIASLLELCRTQGVEIVHLRASFKPDMSDWMLRYKLSGSIPCVQGTSGIETLPFALEEPGEAVLIKHTFDGFKNPVLLQYLRQKEVRFVLTAGLVTSTCVLFTTVSAAQNGFLTAVVVDCCADEPLAHQETLDRYRFIFDRTTAQAVPERHPEWLVDLKKLDEFETRSR
jgi:nicotinamidase-related amidase